MGRRERKWRPQPGVHVASRSARREEVENRRRVRGDAAARGEEGALHSVHERPSEVRKLSSVGEKKAYLRAPVRGDKYVQLPEAAAEEGMRRKLDASLYGTRDNALH